MPENKKKSVKGKEIIIVMVMVFFCLAVIFFMNKRTGGKMVRVSYMGMEYGNYDLNEDRVVKIDTPHGSNVLVIKDRKAYMESADCPDKICVDMMPISEEVQGVIVCLPHKIIIDISGD